VLNHNRFFDEQYVTLDKVSRRLFDQLKIELYTSHLTQGFIICIYHFFNRGSVHPTMKNNQTAVTVILVVECSICDGVI
jgi:hypothetical protein